MKGKNKIILMLFAVMSLIATGVVFAFSGVTESINYASAMTSEAFTTELEGGVVFSAERVYFAEDRKQELTYRNITSHQIYTNTGAEYFYDYGLRDAYNENDYTHKHIISSGDFVMVDDKAVYSAVPTDANKTDPVEIKQGIMLTFGGYYKNGNDYSTNGDNVGANIDFVSAQAFLNGELVTLPNSRGYTSSAGYKEDFTWFIVPSQTTEGYYEVNFTYMIDGKTLSYSFEFYLLLQTSYDKIIEVKGNTYSTKPLIENCTNINNSYSFHSGTSLNYPTLTFDYSRYSLSYDYFNGDNQTEVKLEYDEKRQIITVSKKEYNEVEIKEYPINEQNSNNRIVTLMFVGQGKYDFDFKYIYKNQGETVLIPEEQILFENMELNIYGYQAKYSRAGFASADMTYLEIYQNGTMFILIDGYTDPSSEQTGDNLGVYYKLDTTDASKKTGTVNTLNSKSANVFVTEKNSIYDLDKNDLKDIQYQKTDRGVWLTLNDEYLLSNDDGVQSFYYYGAERITTDYITAKTKNEKGEEVYANQKEFNKITTFTQPGYYLIQVRYEYAEDLYKTQYFAFQITSATPILELFKTTAIKTEDINDENIEKFYANEYTNQNVYANWKETGVFESTIAGKLYYTSGKYTTESALKKVADGGYNSAITKEGYTKNAIIQNSGSYLLVLEVERSSTKTYTYFTIDKEKISGLEVYEVVTYYMDNRAVYAIAQDKNLNYITHTSKAVIDAPFTIDWADKASGASISAKYKFTPFVQVNTNGANNTITTQSNAVTNKYIINNYTIGKTSNYIEINQPVQLGSVLDINNVLLDQGMYEIYLEDQAGNKLTYIMIIDQTKGVINATYGENKSSYISGQMVADYVDIEWGTHKAIDLGEVEYKTVKNLLKGDMLENYYESENNNSAQLSNVFKVISDKNLFVIENQKAQIKIVDKNLNNYYIVTNSGINQMLRPDGVIVPSWDTLANRLFTNVTNMGMRINVDIDLEGVENDGQIRRYNFAVVGENNISNNIGNSFQVYITPDEAKGEVYSSAQEGVDFTTSVMAHGEATKYYDDGAVRIDGYANAQASNDGVFVFEWTIPTEKDNFKVTEVKYDYYGLMEQSALNNLTSKEGYPYYPYQYMNSEYILKTEEGVETVSQYESGERTFVDDKGNGIDTRRINRSNVINLGYESFYENDSLVTRKVTQTGLYIITRTITINADENAKAQTAQMSYVFFVDRNKIISYSINDIKDKLVGQFIHVAMPNSESVTGVHYDNFTKQGLNTYTQTDSDGIPVTYQVYLETNKLPTQIQVPTGKYVSGNIELGNNKDKRDINLTSYLNLDLRLSVYFLDSYNLLPNTYNGRFIKLMDNVTANKDGYIPLMFSSINEGALTIFETARYLNTKDDYLSLPGTYVFTIRDRVGKTLDGFEVTDCNEFTFGIKLTNIAPETDVYGYAQSGDEIVGKVYADGNELYTNQEFVDFIIPIEDLKAYNAQLDIANVEIWRAQKSGNRSLWLKLQASGKGFEANINGIEQNLDRVFWIDKDGNIINQSAEGAVSRLSAYLIKLDTGLEVVDNKIVNYKEYVYTIEINYILKNSGSSYYTYKSANNQGNWVTNHAFSSTTYTVTIDRSPNSENLDNLMASQGDYFTKYQTFIAEQNGVEFNGEINKTFAYRSTKAVGDYYGLANGLYYQLVDSANDASSQAIIAFNVNYNSVFNPDGLSAIYYRKLDFVTNNTTKTRMGLLQITDSYYEGGEYYIFNENRTEYSFYSTENTDFKDNNGNIYYRAIMGANGSQDNYNTNYGSFYEVVEKDLAGNYTQYAIYFAPNEQESVKINVNGKVANQQQSGGAELILNKDGVIEQRTFIGIDSVDLTGIVGEKLPYYGNINIYNASREKINSIYVNSTSKLDNINNSIHDTIKVQGNYTIEYVNVFNEKYTAKINNYTSADHRLNTAALVRKQDYDGSYYILFNGLNTKIDNDTYWYVTDVKIAYDNIEICYTTEMDGGEIKLVLKQGYYESSEVRRDDVELYRLNLANNKQYLIQLTDVGGNNYVVTISTSEGYYAYEMDIPENSYVRDNIVYTANQVLISYNNDFYEYGIEVYLDNNTIPERNIDVKDNPYFVSELNKGYGILTLQPDVNTDPADNFGALRRFKVVLTLKDVLDENGQPIVSQTYEVFIDTRATDFAITNTYKEDKIDFVKSTLKNGGNGDYKDFTVEDLRNVDMYSNLIAETVNFTWTRLSNDYFTYHYELIEFVNQDEYVDLLKGVTDNSYSITPKENTTGKYVFKVTIKSKDNVWIATRVYTMYMSTTITGLYEVKERGDDLGKVYDYSAITNLQEVNDSIKSDNATLNAMATALGFASSTEMNNVFASYGYQTAIPMYISNRDLMLVPNEKNGVKAESYSFDNVNTKITFYRVYTKANTYQTFAVVMQVYPTANRTENILSTLSYSTSENNTETLLNNGTVLSVYNSKANYYKLIFSSYKASNDPTPLEKHNKIIVDVYYNYGYDGNSDNHATIVGGDGPTTPIEFNNSGSYRLEIRDMAGNVQYFSNNLTTQSYFTLIVMKKNDVLYTVNGEAPIQYAYYDKPVTLQINRYNDATGKNNYDINTIKISVVLNSSNYTGYEHPAESATYTFKDYGTYLVTISANLLDTGEEVKTQLVFSILNPNEARTALDFTSIYGYDILSVFSVTKTEEKDVTEKFMDLLKDKSNTGEINVYNKLITYERIVEAFGSETQGKMKFKVLYEVQNDKLLPARRAEFSFTLNNEQATINSSIKPGGKTTKEVTLKFNPANIYDQIGDCNLVVNGENVLRIDSTATNQILEIKLNKIGKYYVQLMGDSGNVSTSFNFTIKEPLNMVSIILIVVVVSVVIALIGTFVWLRTRMKVR